MKILLYEWSGIMQRDVKAVLRRNGHEVIPFSYESPDWKYDEYMFTNMKRYVERYHVDVILSMLFFLLLPIYAIKWGFLIWHGSMIRHL